MHILIVNFQLKDLSEAAYAKACEEQFAAAFRNVPGLLSKIWLSNPETNTYGGVYTWRDRDAMEAFRESELGRSVATNPHFTNLRVTEFGVLDEPTRMTNGMAPAAA